MDGGFHPPDELGRRRLTPRCHAHARGRVLVTRGIVVQSVSMPHSWNKLAKTLSGQALFGPKVLGRFSDDYGISHLRYDLGKLRARSLAERIGLTRRYCLTRIGWLVCRVLAERRRTADPAGAWPSTSHYLPPAAVSA